MTQRRHKLTPETTGMSREEILAELTSALTPGATAWHLGYAAAHPDEWPEVVVQMMEFPYDPLTGSDDGFMHHFPARAEIEWVPA